MSAMRYSVTVRLDEATLARIDALIPWIAQQPFIASLGRIGRTDAIRIALARGLDNLEAERRSTGCGQ